MGRRIAALLAAAALIEAGAAAMPASAAAPGRYVDPQGKFVLAVPADAEYSEPGDKIRLSIRSRRGYDISVQTGAVNPEISLLDMARKLEAVYLGPTKAWTVKLGDRLISIGGLTAFDGVYEGARTRSRVVIARGRETDFVFIFRAPPRVFQDLVPEFEWVLAGFRPADREILNQPAPPAARQAEPASPARAGAVIRFADPELGYSIDYPGDWLVARPSAYTVVFSGRQGTDAGYPSVSIQNVRPPEAKAPAQAATTVLTEIKSDLAAEATDVGYLGNGPFPYEKNGVRLQGQQFVVSFSRQGQRFRQWTVVMPRPSGGVAHVWSYASPEAQFPIFQAVAEAMLNTWIVQN